MPTVAAFNGIKIEFYFDEHPPPHFHARYAEFIAQIDLEKLEIRNGSPPRPQFRMVQDCPGWRHYGRPGRFALPVAILGESNERHPSHNFC